MGQSSRGFSVHSAIRLVYMPTMNYSYIYLTELRPNEKCVNLRHFVTERGTCICTCIIGASMSEPHTNRYYEKIAIVMYVCVCVCVCVSAIRRPRVALVHVRASVRVVNLSLGRAPTITVTFNVDDHFHLEMIVNINVTILERVLADSIEKRSRQSSEDMFHDEIVQEIIEQLGPSYNSFSL